MINLNLPSLLLFISTCTVSPDVSEAATAVKTVAPCSTPLVLAICFVLPVSVEKDNMRFTNLILTEINPYSLHPWPVKCHTL